MNKTQLDESTGLERKVTSEGNAPRVEQEAGGGWIILKLHGRAFATREEAEAYAATKLAARWTHKEVQALIEGREDWRTVIAEKLNEGGLQP